ncbi:hypothetical protein VOLCADRAFT_65690 [Volvox carteri f. nagariensis]|uniref:Ammonium transporter n=1 Tax=Volvox carteri f. nagariensis TaxID=3068 RepID=D8U990_VOLCA|nr:uncharacterized protein VOLCADRAFT_65690 [Volvox carteri f. nagariensis]EFJ43712.1 hypothetical protein VOLCADRAFT_65690 [Volvox carteri f. nagariensis]|eukprot:XP_002955193.1 hypothetical protein VOLCADRAFT_65690 [Volvox carteri f. nagariensis]
MAVGSCDEVLFARVLALLGGDAATARSICGAPDVAILGADGAVTRWMVGQWRTTQQALQQVQNGLNVSFVLTSAYQIFVMQLGFALFAAGVVRPKNIVAIFLKNLFDTCIAGIVFYLVGYAFAFGAKDGDANGFIGNWNFALSSSGAGAGRSGDGPQPWHLFVWNWSFCSAATTILSGSIAERGTFVAYSIYAAVMPSWVYPVVAHWLWSPFGWLSVRNGPNRILGIGAIDYAGSGVVHLVGGTAALVGSFMVGPRVGRFGGDGISPQVYRATAAPQLYLMGTLLLWFGWYGFNPGSRLQIADDVSSMVVGRTAVVTTLSACAGALTGLLLSYTRHKVWDLLSTCVGALAGLVSVTSGCSVLEPWAAIICGIIATFVCEAGDDLLERFKIDDPVSAFPLHGLGGAWGLIFTGLMAKESYIQQVYGVAPGGHRMGLFYGGHAQLLLCQSIAVAVIAGWTLTNMIVLFYVLKRARILRVPADKEVAGMDLTECGQFNARGAVHLQSSKLLTMKGDILLSAFSVERRINGITGFDVSLRNRSTSHAHAGLIMACVPADGTAAVVTSATAAGGSAAAVAIASDASAAGISTINSCGCADAVGDCGGTVNAAAALMVTDAPPPTPDRDGSVHVSCCSNAMCRTG